jgi:transcriptional regulator with XRE-family HTH domain
MPDENNHTVKLGEMLRMQRAAMHLTLQQLSAQANVSPSHLGRIEKGTRFPSARVLHRLAKPLGLEEGELLGMAGFLTPNSPAGEFASFPNNVKTGRVDPYVAKVLGQETPEVQHIVLGILAMLKSIARSYERG